MPSRRFLHVAAVTIVVAAITGVVVWESGVKYKFVPKRWDTVVEGKLYRSGKLSPALVERTWRAHGIKVVVSLDDDEPGEVEDIAACEAAGKLGLQRRIYSLSGDGTGDPEAYVQALIAIDDAMRELKPVHVHCSAGVFRTGAAIALYRVLLEGWNGRDACRELLDHGAEGASEHPLIPYLNRNMEHIAQRLKESGVIEAVPDPLPLLESD
jgi:hypothetical protein